MKIELDPRIYTDELCTPYTSIMSHQKRLNLLKG